MLQHSVQDIMTKDVVTVRPETPLSEISKILHDKGFNGVPVVEKNNVLVGLVTEYDIIDSSVKQKEGSEETEMKDLKNATAKDVMNPEPLTLFEEAPFEKVLQLFRTHHKVNPVPVTNKDKQVVGIVSRSDIVGLFTKLNLFDIG